MKSKKQKSVSEKDDINKRIQNLNSLLTEMKKVKKDYDKIPAY